jgi:hypothetical protein
MRERVNKLNSTHGIFPKGKFLSTLILRLLAWVFLIKVGFTPAFSQSCDCSQNLDSLLMHLPQNYPGWQMKDTQSKFYRSHLAASVLKAGGAKNPKECQAALQQFLAWFGDGHLGVSYSGDVFKLKKNKVQNTPIWSGLNEKTARNFLDSLQPRDSFSGIWESYESFYKALIVPRGRGFHAYLISTINKNWKAGELKMAFEKNEKGKWICTFFTSDHSPENPAFKLNQNLLEIEKITVWNKLYPKTENPVAVEAFVSSQYKNAIEFRPWDRESFYIQLQNLNAGVKPLIDSLLKINLDKIKKSRFLILDLRDNEGGDLTVFDSFWPLILTQKAILYGTNYLCSPKNLTAYRKQLEDLEGQIEPAFFELLAEMEKHRSGKFTLPNDTLWPESGTLGPEKVVLLINETCKSSTEDFILATQSSKKVILAGTRTGGVAVFEEVVDVNLPCPSLILFHPIGVSNRLPAFPLDGKGIEPDIPLKTKSKAWQPWVKEILRVLK